jgi:hypothetical protein
VLVQLAQEVLSTLVLANLQQQQQRVSIDAETNCL